MKTIILSTQNTGNQVNWMSTYFNFGGRKREGDTYNTGMLSSLTFAQVAEYIRTHIEGAEDAQIVDGTALNVGGKCRNCCHWRDKAWTDKGWGICDNPKNETKISLRGMVTNYMRNLPEPEKDQMIEELVREIEDGIRYPEDFGYIFFEPLQGS